jgi:hypothetical protein
MKVYEWVSHLYYRVYWSCFFTRLVGTWVVGVPRQHRYGHRPWGSRDRRAPLRAPQLTQRHLRCLCLAPVVPPRGRGVGSVASSTRAWYRSHVLLGLPPLPVPRTRTQVRMHRLLSIQNSGVAPIALACLALRGGCVNTPAVRHRSDVLLWTSALPGRQTVLRPDSVRHGLYLLWQGSRQRAEQQSGEAPPDLSVHRTDHSSRAHFEHTPSAHC